MSRDLKQAINEQEDVLLACVHCGLCLPHCPTYGVLDNENDSPRGRLWLMRAVAEGRAELADAYTNHMEACVGCRACETACPSGVRFGHVMGIARDDIYRHDTTRLGPVARFARWAGLRLILPWRPALKLVDFGMTIMRHLRPKTGWPSFLPRVVRTGLEMLPPPVTRRVTGTAARRGSGAGTVIQFRGCVMDETFREINDATKRILEVNGFDVEKPLRQGCCGALHDHAGDREYAKKLARNNVDALEDGSETPIIVNAAGCGAMLKEYGDLLEDEVEYAERAKTFSSRIQDVTEFLAKQELVPGAVLPYRVTYDAPCHMYHAQKIQTEPLKMLEAIPRLDFVPLKDSERCCGSGGIYNLTHPEIADEILSPKLDEIEKTGASVVLTANPGCHMQILAGLRMRGINNIEVRHIIDLLDESYQAAGFYG